MRIDQPTFESQNIPDESRFPKQITRQTPSRTMVRAARPARVEHAGERTHETHAFQCDASRRTTRRDR